MRPSIRLPLLILFLACSTPMGLGGDAGDQAERKKLVGVWKGFAVEGRGENPDRGPVKLELRITEKSIHGLEFKGDKVIDHGQGGYVLDLSKTPRLLDASKVNDNGRREHYVGIYALEGDTLKWCVSRKKIRPTEFRTGDGGFLLILKRAKDR